MARFPIPGEVFVACQEFTPWGGRFLKTSDHTADTSGCELSVRAAVIEALTFQRSEL